MIVSTTRSSEDKTVFSAAATVVPNMGLPVEVDHSKRLLARSTPCKKPSTVPNIVSSSIGVFSLLMLSPSKIAELPPVPSQSAVTSSGILREPAFHCL